MKFTYKTALRNLQRKPVRTILLVLMVLVLSLSLFTGAFIIFSLKSGLESYETRLGADIIVVPSKATSKGTVDDILLQGITGNYYMNGKDCEKVAQIEGIESYTKQFFLTSAKASCCSTRVQIIGFDPETDFSVLPWIEQNFDGEMKLGDIIVGADIVSNPGDSLTFYGAEYKVVAKLARTGTGLDSAVYTNMETIKQMAKDATMIFGEGVLDGANIDTSSSAILIKVKDGYNINDVADDINIHITKVEAKPAKTMISNISKGLNGIAKVTGIIIIVVWLLVMFILVITFALLSNERKKEFAIYRIMGASKRMLFKIMSVETALISAIGAVIGTIIGVILMFPLQSNLQKLLGLPFLSPGFATIVILVILAIFISILTGTFTAYLSAKKITKSETGLLLREDA